MFCYFKLKLGDERLKIVTLSTLFYVTGVWVSPLLLEKHPWSISIFPVFYSPLDYTAGYCQIRCAGWIWQGLLLWFLCFSEILVGHDNLILPHSPLSYTCGFPVERPKPDILPTLSNAIGLVAFNESCIRFWLTKEPKNNPQKNPNKDKNRLQNLKCFILLKDYLLDQIQIFQSTIVSFCFQLHKSYDM